MMMIKRIVCGILVTVVLNMVWVDVTFAQKTKKIRKITRTSPSIILTYPEPVPVEIIKSEQGFLGRNKWWILLGAVAVGGAAAAAAGGGGGGDGDNNDGGSTGSGDSGSVTVSWQE